MQKPAWGEGHEEHAYSQCNAGDELQADGNEPGGVGLGGAGAADIVGAVVDPEGYHDAGGDGELLEGDEGAANFRGSNLGIVVGHVDRHGANCQA